MSTMFADTLLIVFISVCTALLAEGITWVLVYRTDKYKRLKAEVEKQSKKCEYGNTVEVSTQKVHWVHVHSNLASDRAGLVYRVLSRPELYIETLPKSGLKSYSRKGACCRNLFPPYFSGQGLDLGFPRRGLGFPGCLWHPSKDSAVFINLRIFLSSLSSSHRFDGRVVAKLPFTPLSYIQGLSHRNLLGDDTTDCSFIFLYILCTMSIRQNIQKILGLAPSRAATKQAGGFLGPPPPSGKFS
ncbi:calcium load-activated calcium channel [Mastomys coucha]|uniref:calcium load-activated calcium channel n=1 Tax=Mastomys coucha TaxID=35658 RepID=UPI001261E1C6|nr:calcium load-activated calcium channel [Mastomys coucha]